MRILKFAGLLAAASLSLAAPAFASTSITLTGNTGVSGTDGNFVTTTATDGAVTVNIRVTAWSIDSSGTVRNSYLGAYGNGVGVTSGDDIGSDGKSGTYNTHTIDNQNRTDFILVQFDKNVKLESANFTSFPLGGSTDSDATISYGKSTLNYMTSPDLDGKARSTALDPLFLASYQSYDDAGTGGVRGINPSGWVGNLWLISASQVNKDGKVDAFKLSSLKFSVPGVPEPATWAMMIAGFGMVGVGIRRRSSRSNAALA